MTKILMISEFFGTKRHGGSENVCKFLARELRKFGVFIEIYGFRNHSFFNALPDLLKLNPLLFNVICPLFGTTIKRIEKKYDLIHFMASTVTISLLCKLNKPTILSIHSLGSAYIEKGLSREKVFIKIFLKVLKLLERRSFKNVNYVSILRKDRKALLVNEYGVNPEKVIVISNFIDPSIFKQNSKKNKDIDVLFVGKGTRRKGLHFLIKNAPKIRGQIALVCPFIDKQYLKEIKKLKNVKIYKNIPLKKLLDVYQRSKLLVIPSLAEEQPLVVLEAMACGLPVVATPEGSGGVIKNGENGFVVNNPENLADYINLLLEDIELSSRMSKCCIKTIEGNYTSNKIVKKYLQLYKTILTEKCKR